MFAAILAALQNPAVDAALVNAASSLIAFLAGLPEKDRERIIAQVDAAAQAEHGQLVAFDADLKSTRAYLDALAAHPPIAETQLAADIKAIGAQLADRFAAPLPTPQIVSGR